MATLFERINGYSNGAQVEKIAIFHLQNDLYLVQQGIIDFNTLVSRHSLEASQATELSTLLNDVNLQGYAEEEAYRRTWHALQGVERGVLDEAGVREVLGI